MADKKTDRRHLGSQARRAAVTTLTTRYAEEFAGLLGDEREKLGLGREPGPVKPMSKLAKLREQLKAAGIDPEA